MQYLSEAADGLRALARPIGPGDKVKAQIARAAKLAGLQYSRAFHLWYGNARSITPHEVEAIRAARLKKARDKQNEIAHIASDFAAVAERAAAVLARASRAESAAFAELAQRARRLADRA